jgi:Fe-S-cluster-containing hydrogenase component 2
MNEVVLRESKGAVLIDSSLCSGCRVCQLVCSLHKTGEIALDLSRIPVMASFLDVELRAMPCLQCEEAECMDACPVEAISIDAGTGAKVVDEELCIGCCSCVEACREAHGAARIRFDESRQVAIKCDLCGGDPQCVRFCPMGALSYRVIKANDEEE